MIVHDALGRALISRDAVDWMSRWAFNRDANSAVVEFQAQEFLDAYLARTHRHVFLPAETARENLLRIVFSEAYKGVENEEALREFLRAHQIAPLYPAWKTAILINIPSGISSFMNTTGKTALSSVFYAASFVLGAALYISACRIANRILNGNPQLLTSRISPKALSTCSSILSAVKKISKIITPIAFCLGMVQWPLQPHSMRHTLRRLKRDYPTFMALSIFFFNSFGISAFRELSCRMHLFGNDLGQSLSDSFQALSLNAKAARFKKDKEAAHAFWLRHIRDNAPRVV